MGSRVARLGALGASLLACACTKTDGGDVGPPPSRGARGSASGSSGSAGASGSSSSSASGSSGGSAGGFSADLAKEIGPGSAAKTDGAKPSGTAAGASGSAASAPAPGAASGAQPEVPKAASASEPDPPRAASSAGSASAPSEPPKAASGAGTPAEPGARTSSSSAPSSAPEEPVKVPTDLAAIKISLLPNWDRDVGTAGTFQYVVRVKGTQSTKTFLFHYGYDDPRAPTDRDQYKKYLQGSKLLTGEIKDRQRGSAWFLEGADASGLPAFRYVVLYGGKHLICYGSLYKDADSNRLGDDRDQTVIQAKQICETLAL